MVEKTAIVLDKMLQNPEVPSSKETLDKHEVTPEQYLQKEEKQEKPANLIDENKVDWSQLEKLGVSKNFLKNTRNLEPMLNFQKLPDWVYDKFPN